MDFINAECLPQWAGVKNSAPFLLPHVESYKLHWRKQWTTLADGLVDWERVLRLLKRAGYDGPLCFHNFYERGMEYLIARTREDLEYVRNILARI